MRDVNHHQLDTFLNWIQHRPIQLRFIELMETGEGSQLFRKHHISGQVLPATASRLDHSITSATRAVFVIRITPERSALSCRMKKTSAPLATVCAFPPLGPHLCLFGEGGVNLRDLLEDDTQQQALEARISAALREKKQSHSCIKTTPVLRKTYRTLAAKTSKGEIR